MHCGVVAVPGCFDSGLTTTLDVLRWAEVIRPTVNPEIPPVTTQVLSLQTEPVATAGGFLVPVDALLEEIELDGFDVLMVPSVGVLDEAEIKTGLQRPDVARLTEFLRRGSLPPAVRVAAACTGTFILAEAGLLDGRQATTTWWLADAFRQRYPAIDLDLERMVVWSGPVTTAGAAFAHIDLALSLLHRHSPLLARRTSEVLLIDRRPADSVYGMTGYLVQSDELVRAFETYALTHLAVPFTIASAAAAIGTTRKTLERRTRDCAGISPHEMVQRLRVERARHLRRVTAMSMDEIAHCVGYRSASTLRSVLRRAS